MHRAWNEQKVLDKLQIEDFRHLTKDKVISMATMLDKMDPEVAKKALDQFPEFAKTMRDILADYKQSLEAGIKSNDESMKACYEGCNQTIVALHKMLENDEISFENKQWIIEHLMELHNLMANLDAKNKGFIATMQMLGVLAVGIVGGAALSALGGNAKFDFKNIPTIKSH